MPKYNVKLIAECAVTVEASCEIEAMRIAEVECDHPAFWWSDDIVEVTD